VHLIPGPGIFFTTLCGDPNEILAPGLVSRRDGPPLPGAQVTFQGGHGVDTGQSYDIFAPSQTVDMALTYDANSAAPPVSGEFNLEVVINSTGTGNYPTPPGYQGVLIESVPGKTMPPTVTMLHGNYGLVDGAGNDRIFLGDGSESVGGALGDTLAGGTGLNQFLDGHLGNQSILGGTAGTETIWGGPGDTIRGGSGGNETIGGAPGDTITGGSGGNEFIDGARGNQSIVGGSGGNETIWGGAGDTIQGASGSGSALIGFAGGNETLWDDGATTTGHDSVSTFSQAGGDRVSLNSATDTIANVVGTASTSGGNTTVTLHDGSTITFIGISGVNNTFFTTH
jgi:Ca2+-binding RTX toxin-like protein